MVRKTGWYLIDLLHDGATITVVKRHVDAVFATSFREAIEQAMARNPYRPGQMFGAMLAIYDSHKRLAIKKREQRDNQIAEMYEIARKLK